MLIHCEGVIRSKERRNSIQILLVAFLGVQIYDVQKKRYKKFVYRNLDVIKHFLCSLVLLHLHGEMVSTDKIQDGTKCGDGKVRLSDNKVMTYNISASSCEGFIATPGSVQGWVQCYFSC